MTFAEDVFEQRPKRGPRLSRRMKRKDRHNHRLARAKDQRVKGCCSDSQDLSKSRRRCNRQTRHLKKQEGNGDTETLAEPGSYFWKEGILYWRWSPAK